MTDVPITDPRVPRRTPWGPPDFAILYSDGIVMLITPGHGGFHVDRSSNAQVHEAWRRAGGWYEEDAEADVVVYTFPDLFPTVDQEIVRASLRNWHPDQWEAVTGEKVTAEQSFIVAKREWLAEHADDWIVYSAIRQPDGMVGVMATNGAAMHSIHGVTRYFLVPQDEYDARGPHGFVVDPQRHATWERVTHTHASPEGGGPSKS